MIFTTGLLQQLEQNAALKKNYLGAGSWGQNKIVYLPVIIGVMSAYSTYEMYGMSKMDSSYIIYMLACLAITAICILAVILIQKNAKKKVAENIDDVPVCIAKKVYGNDDAGIYYGIYTTGSKRHDIDFIEHIADKIFNIEQEPDKNLKNKISKMFRMKLAQPQTFAVRLPGAFTDGEEVYQRQFSFVAAGDEMKKNIAENNDRFIVLAFHKVNALQVKQKDLLPYSS